jgi:GNAT superfamily N-acetyltransferase
MAPEDLDRADEIHAAAFALPGALGSPFLRARVIHTLTTDPAGAFVALGPRGRVVGVAMATRRDGLWALSLLAVDPDVQERGIGWRLLTAALGYAQPADARMILSSHDQRAQHLYARAGLVPRPTVAARGTVARRRFPLTGRPRRGDAGDLALCDAVDRQVRGFMRPEDLAFLLANGSRLWIVDDAGGQGYALGQAERLSTLCATDGATAAALLAGVIAAAGPGEFEVGWLTEGQDWAYPVLFRAGLDVLPWGPIWVAGGVGRLVPYVPSGALL